MKNIALFLSVAGLCIAACATAAPPTVRLTVHVLTPEGVAVKDAFVGAGSLVDARGGAAPDNFNGRTDAEGKCTAMVSSYFERVGAFARAPGFYETEVRDFKLSSSGDNMMSARQRGRWEPWSQEIRLVLKPIKNPVPMYARKINLLVPEVRKPVGYDLEVGDWVAPYGTGRRADLEFTVDGQYESRSNYNGTFTLRFPGEGNGIQAYEIDPNEGSALKLPYEAPENGYQESWIWHNARITPPKRGATSRFVREDYPWRGFIFRVRAVTDSDGRILQAKYGKIHGPVYFQTFEHGQARVGFTYYLNPDGTRNLEFDPERNLSSNLSSDERVYDP